MNFLRVGGRYKLLRVLELSEVNCTYNFFVTYQTKHFQDGCLLIQGCLQGFSQNWYPGVLKAPTFLKEIQERFTGCRLFNVWLKVGVLVQLGCVLE